jgi:UDP-4-amino-4,6-dideoxy-L-N-acetyl-beta-L-altrosamine transaminase
MNRSYPYAKHSINDDDIESVVKALKSGMITRGPQVKAFEEAIAEYCGAKYAVAFSSATAGLFAACRAVNVCKYDRIVTTPNSFVATISCGWQSGAEPLFVDIDRATGNMDLELVKLNAIYESSRGRNIFIPVHFSGIPVDMEKLERMITDPEAVVIEDAAHALGSKYNDGSRVGCCKWSNMTVFSFHPAKNITSGEGGMVTTNDEALYHRLRLLRDSGIERNPESAKDGQQPWLYEVEELSGNYNITEMQAALGLSQLNRLEQFIEKRRALMALYREKLAHEERITFFVPEIEENVAYHLCVVQIDFDSYGVSRGELMNRLKAEGIVAQGSLYSAL